MSDKEHIDRDVYEEWEEDEDEEEEKENIRKRKTEKDLQKRKTEEQSIYDFNEELLSEFDYVRLKVIEKRIFDEKNEFFLTLIRTIPETFSLYKFRPWNKLAVAYSEALSKDTSYEQNETLIEYSLKDEDAYQMEFWDLDFTEVMGFDARICYLCDEKEVEGIYWDWDRFTPDEDEDLEDNEEPEDVL